MHRKIPIIKLFRTLIVSIQIEISDDVLVELKSDVAHEPRVQDVDALIIEVSGIDLFDSYIACSIRDLAQICRMLGVRTVLVGLVPAMAITLVEMGMEMQGVETALNMDIAMLQHGGVAPVAREEDELEWLDAHEPTEANDGEQLSQNPFFAQ